MLTFTAMEEVAEAAKQQCWEAFNEALDHLTWQTEVMFLQFGCAQRYLQTVGLWSPF